MITDANVYAMYLDLIKALMMFFFMWYFMCFSFIREVVKKKRIFYGQADRKGGGAPCIGERTISFLVKFESSVLCTLMAYIGHLGYFIPHLMNK